MTQIAQMLEEGRTGREDYPQITPITQILSEVRTGGGG